MIITRAPLRIPLGGGGTDLPSYYSKREGALVSTAIDKYIYMTVKQRFEDSFRISYSRTEICDSLDQIQHPIVREAIRFLGIDQPLEITSIADMPASTGMGSSSTFTVALLLALHTFQHKVIPQQELAEQAYHIEREILGEPVGKQDQYLASFGGILTMDLASDGVVTTGNMTLEPNAHDDFDSNLLMFYTGIRRSASDILRTQDSKAAASEADVLSQLDNIKRIGFEIRAALRDGQVHRFGELMNEHWQFKKKLSGKITNPDINRWYDLALQAGAVGGKLMGAGGGGCLVFYCDPQHKAGLRTAMAQEGLKEVRFLTDWDGAKIIANV